jgi:hypothetical protein
MARTPDVDRQPVSVIPALCRGWRLMVAIRSFPFWLIVCYTILFWILQKNFHLDDIQHFSQNFDQMLQFLYLHQWTINIPVPIIVILTLSTFEWFSIWIYKWWYSK